MKISVNNQDLFMLSEFQKKVIKDEIGSEDLDLDLKRRLIWVLTHKYEMCFTNLKAKWDRKLMERGIKMIPINPEEYANLVFSQPDYQDASSRRLSEKEQMLS